MLDGRRGDDIDEGSLRAGDEVESRLQTERRPAKIISAKPAAALAGIPPRCQIP